MLSFIANFYLTAYFTFGRKPHGEKAFGFEEHTYAAICYTWVAEPLSLDGIPNLWPHSGFRHRHSGQLLTVRFVFKRKE